MARPTIYTAELADLICERLAQGESLVEICRDEHMPGLRTAMRWARENRDFAVEYQLARAAQAEVMDHLIVAAAKDASGDPHAARVKIDAYKWRASKLAPKRYGDKVQHTAGDGEGPIETNITVTFVKAGDLRKEQRLIEAESRAIDDGSGPY